MSQAVTITLSPKLVSELEPLAAEAHVTVEGVVNTAVAEYLRLREKRRIREQLAKQYEELAAMWNELAEDLASEKWVEVENEALLEFEKGLAQRLGGSGFPDSHTGPVPFDTQGGPSLGVPYGRDRSGSPDSS